MPAADNFHRAGTGERAPRGRARNLSQFVLSRAGCHGQSSGWPISLDKIVNPPEGDNVVRPLVGRHDVREAVRPPREIPDGPFLRGGACAPAHFAGALTVLGRSRFAGAYCACRTAIGRTSNKSAAAKLGPVIVCSTASTVRIAEKPSANTDAFQAWPGGHRRPP